MLWMMYRIGTSLGGPLIDGYLRRRERHGREDPERRGERRGLAGVQRPAGRLIWLHAASAGESVSVLPLIERLLVRDQRCHILVTTGTVTSAKLMGERLPARAIHQYVPVDRIAWVRRFLNHWQPDSAIFVESELWPNLLLETHRRDVPMALVNARMSTTSAQSWRRVPRAIRRLLSCFTVCLAQSDQVAGTLRDLGAGSVSVAGNLKLTAPPLAADPAQLAALRESAGSRPIWLAACTHAGEESKVAEAALALRRRYPDLLTVIAPRHPSRSGEVAALLRGKGLELARRSEGEPILAQTECYLADTFGELGLFYRLADVAFVGGSWVERGGQNPYEAAQLGCPVLFGSDMTNNLEISTILREAGAAQLVVDVAACVAALDRLLGDAAARAAMADAGRAVAAEQQGVLDRLERALAPVLRDDRTGGPGRTTGMTPRSVGHARA